MGAYTGGRASRVTLRSRACVFWALSRSLPFPVQPHGHRGCCGTGIPCFDIAGPTICTQSHRRIRTVCTACQMRHVAHQCSVKYIRLCWKTAWHIEWRVDAPVQQQAAKPAALAPAILQAIKCHAWCQCVRSRAKPGHVKAPSGGRRPPRFTRDGQRQLPHSRCDYDH